MKTRQNMIESLIKDVSEMKPDQWEKMWLQLGRTIPVNASTGKAYRGGNRWTLLSAQMARGYTSCRWLTRRQGEALGGKVRESEWGNDRLCEYWTRVFGKKKDKTEDGEDEKKGGRGRLTARSFWVYHVSQFDGLPEEVVNGPVAELKPVELRYEDADRLVAATGAVIRHGDDRAYYSPTNDIVAMPDPAQFLGANEEEKIARYYATLLHELGHWTGHSSRLNRLTLTYFGSPEYAKEELVAEFASAILCAELGLPMEKLQHPEYLANWLQVVKEDPGALLKGANAAEAAVAHLYSYSKIADAKEESEEAEDVAKAA